MSTAPSTAPSGDAPRVVRWGIIGPGRIAESVVPDFAHVPDAEVVAVASRAQERAQAFADKHGIARAYGGYGGILGDDEVDAVYIATPHPQHEAVALACVAAGKAVLVEKSFTATVAGAERVVDLARREQVFVMEAMWTRFQPVLVKIRELVADGAIGEVRQVQADLGVDRPYDPTDRLFDLAQGGGAMLDLGVYVVSLAQHFLGTPSSVRASGSLAPTGADAESGLLLGYDDGRAAALLVSLRSPSPGSARLHGTKGWIEIHPRFHHPRSFTLGRTGAETERFDLPPLGVGYSHEIIEVDDCLRAGRTESDVMPLADSLAVQRVLNEACEQLGVHHREDERVAV